MSRLAVVIIPVYKENPEAQELKALTQCLRVLHKHAIVFIGPNRLNTKAYRLLCGDKSPFHFIPFEDHFFSGITGYNRLMLSPFFYRMFFAYRYLLIHQPDAYVFKDDLNYWCRQGYDYIGAPNTAHENQEGEISFLKGYTTRLRIFNRIFRTNHQVSNVGNGGFSLRKTRKCYWLLRLLQKQVVKWGTNNEDGFFKYWGNLLYPFFRLPSDERALFFSIEERPAESLQKLQGVLPFGCHAFEKYEPETWRPFIPEI